MPMRVVTDSVFLILNLQIFFFFVLFVAFMSHYLSVDLFNCHQYGHSFYIGI